MNKATFYMLPLVGKALSFYNQSFINCFVGVIKNKLDIDQIDANITKDENKYILVLELNKEYLKSPIYEELLNFIDNHPLYMSSYVKEDSPDSKYFTFSLESVNKLDISCFINGKYSLFSDKHKKTITRFYGKFTNVYKSLYPTQQDREALEELLSEGASKVTLEPTAEIVSKPSDKEVLSFSAIPSFEDLNLI